ncbi:transposase [Streptomyces sp. A3M-1-3]|uniref:IS701 family transposase n=1 Tax=Streptomyces sp. A3M-1-3 TaxID=2962044 RepID=UPI0020B8FDFC|nr:transposase [Streptomyces sp. A3M-1-3]MCP3822824.1 transposase [Streptomyces sp. A3M-1-3]
MRAVEHSGPAVVGTGHDPSRPEAVRAPIDEVVDDLCASVFTSLRRRDQREKGKQYVRGLLATRGRKSIRNIAAQIGSPAADQSLHHFIANSTWDWKPIRASLAQYLEAAAPLTAWVVQPMAIPKSGGHSVGVGRRLDPRLGQMFHGQQAFGLWFTSEEVVSPVSWRLFLPDLAPEEEIDPGGAPEAAQSETLEECAATTVLDTVRQWGMPKRPVLLDGQGVRTSTMTDRFAQAGLPVIAGVNAATQLRVADPALPGYGAGALPAREILQSVTALRRPAEWFDPARSMMRRSSLVVAVLVMLPNQPPTRLSPLLLMGEWSDPRRLPSRLWLTDLTRAHCGSLLRLTKQVRRVSLAASHSIQDVGLRDFAGRSLHGWHRHVTMASVAHAAWSLSRPSQSAPAPCYASAP